MEPSFTGKVPAPEAGRPKNRGILAWHPAGFYPTKAVMACSPLNTGCGLLSQGLKP